MNKQMKLLITAILSGAIVTGCSTDYKNFEAVTVKQNGSFELEMNADDAFPLFTAPGEELWISIWEPFILNGDGYEDGTVWVTQNHGHTTYWYVIRYDTERKIAKYVRVTPDVDTGTVEVSVSSNGSGGKSIVNVTYQLTGLSNSGNEGVVAFTNPSAYSQMMEDWRRMIHDNRETIDTYLGK